MSGSARERRRVRLGMITPSSNTVLEPVTMALAAAFPEISVHFTRIRVTEISLEAPALSQFDPQPMLAAAALLADARCDAVCWNGTSAGWLGIERDRQLCAAMTERTGIPATTAVLAMLDALRALGARRLGLVSPYTGDVQDAIVANLAKEGFDCAAERHAGISVNFDFAALGADAIAGMVREVAAARPDAIAIFCTNMDGATLAHAWSRELGMPIVDSIAAALWGALRASKAACAGLVQAPHLFPGIGAR